MSDMHLIYMGPNTIHLESDIPKYINIEGQEFINKLNEAIDRIQVNRELSVEEIVVRLASGSLVDVTSDGRLDVETLISLAKEIKLKCQKS